MGNQRNQLVQPLMSGKNNSAKKQKMSDNAHKETMWRKRQAVCYTTHYRGILSVISSFPVEYYYTNKGNYVSPDVGQRCDPTTVYPIPTGDLLEHGKTHPETRRGVKIPDGNTPDNDIPDVWKEYQKKHEEDHRRCSRAALDDQQFTAERAHAEYDAWQDKIKQKNAVQLSLCDKVNKAGAINHGDVELIDLSEKKDAASSSKDDSPISHAAKWHQVDSSHYKKSKIEEDAPKTITADGGFPLTLIKTEDPRPHPEEEDRSTQGFKPTENAKDIKTKPIDPPIEPASYEIPPIRDQMSTDARISLIIDAVNHIADNDDPESQTFLHKMMKAIYDLEISKKSSSSSSSSSGAKRTKEENFTADAVMADANFPRSTTPTGSASASLTSTSTSRRYSLNTKFNFEPPARERSTARCS